jgi:trimeric autotransporter adhesin
MRLSKLVILFCGLMLFISGSLLGQTINSFAAGGPWNNTGTWVGGVIPLFNNSTRININGPVTVPSTYNSGSPLVIDQVTINTGGTLTIQSGAQVNLNNGGSFEITFSGTGVLNVSGYLLAPTGVTYSGSSTSNMNFLSGSTYEHQATAANTVIPTASYDPNSTLYVTGYTGGGNINNTSWEVPLGNVTLNCASMAAGSVDFGGHLQNILGSLTIQNSGSTGRFILKSTAASTGSSTITIGGNLSVSGTSALVLATTATGIQVNVGGSFTFNSSSPTVSGTVGGANGLATLQVNGDTNIQGGIWDFSSGNNGIGTFDLNGNLTVAAGVTLEETGGGTSQGNLSFTSSTKAQTVGLDPAAIFSGTINATIDNTFTSANVTLTNPATPLTLSNLTLTAGAFVLNGATLTVNGNVAETSGSIDATTTSSIIFGGTNANTFPSDLTFAPGSSFAIFKLNRASVTLATSSSFTVTTLELYAGTLNNTGTITMASNGLVDREATTAANTGSLSNPLTATASSTYNVSYTDNVALASGPELPTNATDLGNLTKLGTNTLTIGSSFTVNGDLLVSAGTLTVSAGFNTTVVGNFTNNSASTFGSAASTFTFASGNPATASLSGTTAPTFSGALVFSDNVSDAVGFRVNGNVTVGSGVTVTASAGTATFGGTSVITSSGTLNLSTVTILANSSLTAPAGDLGIAGNFTVTNATSTFTNGGGRIVFNGTTSILGTGTKTFNDVLVASSGNTVTSAVSLGINGNLDNEGTINFTAGTLTFAGTTQTISGAGSNSFFVVTVSSGTVTANSGFTAGSTLTLTGSLVGNAPITVMANVAVTPGSFTSSSTVTFAGTTTMTGAGTKTFKDVVLSGTSLTPNSAYTVTGNYSISGTAALNAGNNTTTFGGSTILSNAGSGAVTFNNITISGGNSLTANQPITISGTTFTGTGNFTSTSSVTLSHAGTTTFTGAGTKTFKDITINVGTTLTINAAYTVNGNLTINGTLSAGNNTATFGGSTTILGTPTAVSFLNVIINSLSSLTAWSGTTTISGSFTNGGTFNSGGGTIALSASATTHTISGTSPATFNNITIANGGAATDAQFSSSQNLAGVLTIAANAHVSMNGNLTLLSTSDDPAADASIAALPAGAVVTGNVNVQRFINHEMPVSGSPVGIYRYLSAPVIGAEVLNWQSTFAITGPFTGASTTDPSTGTNQVCGFTIKPASASMFTFNATTQAYADYPISGGSNTAALVQGVGYAAFIRNCSSPVINTLTGTIYNGSTVPFSFTSQIAFSGAGANYSLVGNPYPSAIDWGSGAVGWTRPNIANVIAIRTNGTGMGTFVYLDASVANQYIASGQAFWVRATTATTTLTALETVKAAPAAGSYQFYRIANPGTDNLTISVDNGTITDQAVIRLNPSAQTTLDNFDGPKLDNDFFDLSTLSSDNIQMAVNAMSSITCGSQLTMNLKDFTAGNYHLNFKAGGLISSLVMTLHDAYLGTSQIVSQNPDVTFTVDTNAGSFAANRFTLSFSEVAIPLDNPVDSNLKVCGTDAATINLSNPSPGIKYVATLGNKAVSDTLVGTGSSLKFIIPSSQLKVGMDTVVFVAQGLCGAVTLNQVSLIQHDTLYTAKVQGASNCRSGSLTLNVSGAPVSGTYNWYDAVNEQAPIFTGPSYTTPMLAKTKTYYAASVNSLGCEGTRVPVNATIVNYDDAVISELDQTTLQSNFLTGNHWSINGVPLQDTTATLKVVSSGIYQLEVKIGNCSTSAERNMIIAGLENSLTEIRAYPNPVVSMISVEVPSNRTIDTIVPVFNALGAQIGSVSLTDTGDIKKGQFDFSPQASGLYIIRVNLDGALNSIKVIKK